MANTHPDHRKLRNFVTHRHLAGSDRTNSSQPTDDSTSPRRLRLVWAADRASASRRPSAADPGAVIGHSAGGGDGAPRRYSPSSSLIPIHSEMCGKARIFFHFLLRPLLLSAPPARRGRRCVSDRTTDSSEINDSITTRLTTIIPIRSDIHRWALDRPRDLYYGGRRERRDTSCQVRRSWGQIVVFPINKLRSRAYQSDPAAGAVRVTSRLPQTCTVRPAAATAALAGDFSNISLLKIIFSIFMYVCWKKVIKVITGTM